MFTLFCLWLIMKGVSAGGGMFLQQALQKHEDRDTRHIFVPAERPNRPKTERTPARPVEGEDGDQKDGEEHHEHLFANVENGNMNVGRFYKHFGVSL